MLMDEFTERTGVIPTQEEYAEIEEQYYNFNSEKDEFCKAFLRNGLDKKLYQKRADKIHSLEKELEQLQMEKDKEITLLNTEMRKLKEQLDAELEWKPCSGCGTNMSQEDYIGLRQFCSQEECLSEKAAKEIIFREFGFAKEKIIIVNEVCTYESNKYAKIRIKDTYKRQPLYSATDWNYIRFYCTGWQYEMVNGMLYTYNS